MGQLKMYRKALETLLQMENPGRLVDSNGWKNSLNVKEITHKSIVNYD